MTDPQVLYATVAGVSATVSAILGGFSLPMAADIGRRTLANARERDALRSPSSTRRSQDKAAQSNRLTILDEDIAILQIHLIIVAVNVALLLLLLTVGTLVPLFLMSKDRYSEHEQDFVVAGSLTSLLFVAIAFGRMVNAFMTAGLPTRLRARDKTRAYIVVALFGAVMINLQVWSQ